ncbi:hypothetical protein EXIGLDRAFT_833537 [Exidia glandulosa HHB12029]|uniref:F-box domain-containing protein n=1 Tax=Exidia glandulosa HHB12029 TaxID=1314781 RepID=A0A165KMM6_EXIGL|nr:hypothetical protein EXIGLDRAFT_833537 [Exidia glandulosa HHB12029]
MSDPVPAVASQTTEHAVPGEESVSADTFPSSRQHMKDIHPRSDIAQILAHDVLLTIFDPFSLPELLALSSVCQQWRAVVCAHPTYWRSVSLTKPADGAVDFFLARVAASSTSLIAITVQTRVLTNARRVSKVLDAIRNNLSRIKLLDLDFDSFPTSNHHSLTRALSNSAPSLQHLALCSSSPTVLLPRRLFGCDLPQLQTLALVGFDLRNSYPPAFEGAKDLSYASTTSHLNFAQALRRHRNLETLTLLGFPYSSLLTAALPSLGKLSTLHLDVIGHGLLLLLDSLQHLHTISVSMLSGCPAADDAFVRHLKGDLHMTLPLSGWNTKARTARIDVVEIGPSKRSRCVRREPIETFSDEPLDYDAVLYSITAATIPFGLLMPMQHWFESNLLSLRHMHVVIDNGADEHSDAHEPFLAFLNCPKLERLEIINGSRGRTQISPNDVYCFAFKVFNVGTRKRFDSLEIAFENVTIGGRDRYSLLERPA